MSESSSEYLFDNRAIQAGDRFRALSSLFDPVTFRHLDAVGLGPNWRCGEVGAGGPTVANRMADRSGAGGSTSGSIPRSRSASTTSSPTHRPTAGST